MVLFWSGSGAPYHLHTNKMLMFYDYDNAVQDARCVDMYVVDVVPMIGLGPNPSVECSMSMSYEKA